LNHESVADQYWEAQQWARELSRNIKRRPLLR
jgi:hypothetical protein